MGHTLFTLAEANSLLPRLEPLLRRLMASQKERERRQAIVDEFRRKASLGGGALAGENLAEASQEIARLTVILREGLREIESWGCLVKDLDLGLVDFVALRGNEHVFLCWRPGEAEIRFWHSLEEGFAGRKPIDEGFLT